MSGMSDRAQDGYVQTYLTSWLFQRFLDRLYGENPNRCPSCGLDLTRPVPRFGLPCNDCTTRVEP